MDILVQCDKEMDLYTLILVEQFIVVLLLIMLHIPSIILCDNDANYLM